MTLLEILRKKNRTLLEMHIGMLIFGAVCQVTGLLCLVIGSATETVRMPGREAALPYTLSLWIGVGCAALSAWHMNRTLERSLDCGEAAAQKMIFSGFLIRYVLIVVIMLIIIMSGILNPLVAFLGYMSLKAAALLQPFTHKLCNKVFRETDPEPQPVEYDGQEGGEETVEEVR